MNRYRVVTDGLMFRVVDRELNDEPISVHLVRSSAIREAVERSYRCAIRPFVVEIVDVSMRIGVTISDPSVLARVAAHALAFTAFSDEAEALLNYDRTGAPETSSGDIYVTVRRVMALTAAELAHGYAL